MAVWRFHARLYMAYKLQLALIYRRSYCLVNEGVDRHATFGVSPQR
jgi:hypothetical protein